MTRAASMSDASTTDDTVEVMRVPSFRRLWFANLFRGAAAEVAVFALPVTALVLLNASVLQMSMITVCARLGYPLVGLPAGVWVDRWNKRAVLVFADLAFALAFISIPVTYVLDLLTVWQLFAVSLVVSLAGVLFDVAHTSILPLLLSPRRVADGAARLQTPQLAIQAVSPSVAGLLVQAVATPFLYGLAAVGHAISLLFLRGAATAPAPTEQRHFGRELVAGVQALIRQPLLRLLALMAALNNIGAGILVSLLPLLVLRELGLPPVVFGLVSSLGAAAGVVGSLISPRLRRRFGEIRMTLVFSAMLPVAVVGAPLAAVVPAYGLGLVLAASMLVTFTVVGRSVAAAGLRARVTPTRLMARVSSAYGLITQGATPVGALLGGLLATWWSVPVALWVGVAEMALPLVLLLASPVRSMRSLPPEWEVTDEGRKRA